MKSYISKFKLKNQVGLLSLANLKINATSIRNNKAAANLKPYDAIPGPKQYPLIGSMLSIKDFGGDLDILDRNKFMKDLNKKYGDLVKFAIFSKKEIYTFNPEHAKILFQAEATDTWPKREIIEPMVIHSKNKGLVDGLINSQGELWRQQRSAANPILARPATIAQYLPLHNSIIDEFISLIKDRFSSENTLNISKFQTDLKLLAFEIIFATAFDERINCIDVKKTSSEILTLIKNVQSFDAQTAKLFASLPIWRYFRTKEFKKFEKMNDQIFEVSRNYVSKAMEKLKGTNIENNNQKTILQQFILNKEKSKLSDTSIIVLMSEFLLAGIETTSNSLHFLLYELGRHKEVQEEIYNEITNAVKSNESVTEATLNKMPLLKAAVKESARLHSLSFGTSRYSKKDLVLDGYLIPKNTGINTVHTLASLSEKYFKNASEFDPKRWLDSRAKDIHPYSSLQFGHGARMCIGRRLADQEMYLITIKLLQNFKIEYVGEIEKEPIWHFILIPGKDLNVKFTKRVNL